MIELQATTRLSAFSTQQRLCEFVKALSPAEQKFFYIGLPRLIDLWFDFLEKGSEHLPMQFASTVVQAAKYKHVDALAVALGHIRHIYTPKPPTNFVYRSLLVDGEDRLPQTDIFNFKSDRKWSALQSWTYKRDPEVNDRNIEQKNPVELVLRTASARAQQHMLTDYIQLRRLGNDAVALCQNIGKTPEADVDGASKTRPWINMLAQINRFSSEEEALLYVPAGTVLKCQWRAYHINDRGSRLKLIKE